MKREWLLLILLVFMPGCLKARLLDQGESAPVNNSGFKVVSGFSPALTVQKGGGIRVHASVGEFYGATAATGSNGLQLQPGLQGALSDIQNR